jgi:hypothetical protein
MKVWKVAYMQNIRIRSGSMFFHALRMGPLRPFFGLKMISLPKKKVYELSGKALLQNRKWTGLVAHRPWQALPVVNSWAASAYCKLHTLIFLIIYFLAHNTFMHRTSEALSGSHVELEQFLAIWI